MTKRVLDVGNCAADRASIRDLINSHFDAQIVQTDGIEDTLRQLQDSRFDLVLINRKLDRDQSDGLAIIQRLKADPELVEMPVMMLTNFAEHQRAAVEAGAEPGFGKAELHETTTIEKLGRFLA